MKINPIGHLVKTNPIQTQFLQRPKSLAGKSGHTLIFQKHYYALAGKFAIQNILGFFQFFPNFS